MTDPAGPAAPPPGPPAAPVPATTPALAAIPVVTPPPEPAGSPTVGRAWVRRSRWSVPLVWLVPIVAALVALSLLARAWQSLGPRVTISFQSAAGLEAGKTAVKYKDVVIGTVRAIDLTEDHSRVLVQIALTKSAEAFARADSRFWVVRPRIGLGGVSGIDTLLSGAYIAADLGTSNDTSSVFVGLEQPPSVIRGTPGKSFLLQSEELGSLGVGSPVYYRRIEVGEVASYSMNPDGQGVSIEVFVRAPYDQQVKRATRFWNASGLDVSLNASGLKVDTQSLATVLSGGIAFATPFRGDHAPAADRSRFMLESGADVASAPPDGPGQYVQMRFRQAVRGLQPGAPVELMGQPIGRVVRVDIEFDAERRGRERFPVVVGAMLHPQRLERLHQALTTSGTDPAAQAAQWLRRLVDEGVRGRLQSGNLLTGQIVVALEPVPGAPPVAFDATQRPLRFPTLEAASPAIGDQLGSILAKVERLPIERIGQQLDRSLTQLAAAIEQMRGGTLPKVDGTLVDARSALVEARGALAEARGAIQKLEGSLQGTLEESRGAVVDLRQTLGAARNTLADDGATLQSLQGTLSEVQRAARALRGLSEQLGRQPDALLRGRLAVPAGDGTAGGLRPAAPARAPGPADAATQGSPAPLSEPLARPQATMPGPSALPAPQASTGPAALWPITVPGEGAR